MGMRWSRKAGGSVVAMVLIGGLAIDRTAAHAQEPPAFTLTIQGNPVVGETLTAVPSDPSLVTGYEWRRCTTEPPSCIVIADAAGDSYLVVGEDAGKYLEVDAQSPGTTATASTALVTHPPPPPTPEPTPVPTPQPTPVPTLEPTPSPGSGQTEGAGTFAQAGTRAAPPPAEPWPSSFVAAPLPLLHPFPVVRVKGVILERGALITLLRVKAPSDAIVAARCDGPGCRLRRRSVGPGRISALERFLRIGTRVTVRVFKPGAVGKYVRFVIRDGTAPRRLDACVIARRAKPAGCPTA
jgi:hypothetical protein